MIRSFSSFLLSLIFVLSAANIPIHAASIRVVDGDTIVIDGEKIRIANIDTPETRRARCANERILGVIATNRVRDLLSGAEIGIVRGDPLDGRLQDRYGRTLAVISVNGKDLGEILIAEGLARRWPDGPKFWC